MQIRSRLAAGVKLDMTPMIDIVFQLLVFFAMTLKFAVPEGDLAMLPPAKFGPGSPPSQFVPPMIVELRSDERGGLASLTLNGRALAGVEELHAQVESLVGHDPAVAQAAEARIKCDRELAYEHAVAAVTAISGTRLESGQIKPLVGKVRFVER